MPMFEICRIWIFQFRQFPPFFVLLKVIYLVTLFDRKLQVFKNSSKLTILGAVVISYTFYFMRSTFKCYTISSNQTFKSYTISISYQFNFQMLYIHRCHTISSNQPKCEIKFQKSHRNKIGEKIKWVSL